MFISENPDLALPEKQCIPTSRSWGTLLFQEVREKKVNKIYTYFGTKNYAYLLQTMHFHELFEDVY